MSEVFHPYSEYEANEEAEQMKAKIASGEASNYTEAEKGVDKERIKKNLEETLESLRINRFGNSLHFLAAANLLELKDVTIDLYRIHISRAADVVLESDDPYVVFHQPVHTAHDYLREEYKGLTDGLGEKWQAIGKLLVILRAAQRADEGFFNEEKNGAARYYRRIGMDEEADRFETMKNDSHDNEHETCSEMPYVGKIVAKFREEIRKEDLFTPEETEKIRVDAIEKIEKVLADLEK
ncbi:MAG: hypothetical protein KBD19_00920 [Candidatus Moranbacteria bacterium]|nr:hypothetical protein [Candidatus Moranbacteria bacterium]